MQCSVWVLLATIIGSAIGTAAEPKLSLVFDPPRLPADERLTQHWHLDRPHGFTPGFKTRTDWEARARQLRTQLLVANGLWPMPPKAPLNPVIHGKIDRDEYTIEKVFFASLPGHYVSGNLYRPKGKAGKSPAVLCPHGHWANGRLYENSEAAAKKEIESGAEKTLEGARYPLQARCATLARMGCVVFFYDMVGYADSQSIKHRAGFTDVEAELRLQSAMGLQTWNSIRALDFLAGLPEVDARRIAVTGASGGGTQTFILCAIDDRPAVSFPAVMVSTKMQGGCICENCSLLRVGTNNIEMAALFAPKPQAMTGADDWTNEIETRGLPELKKVYALYGAQDRVHAKYAPFPHNYNQVSREMMYDWLNKHLQLGLPEPVVEKPFTPVPPKELVVFDESHPRPKDASDATAVRKYLTDSAEEQLAELARRPEEFRKVVRQALEALVVDRLPDKAVPAPGSFKTLKGDGFEVHHSLLTRPDSSAQVPTIGIIPSQWNRTLVIWTHPDGKAGLFEKDGRTPSPALQALLQQKVAVLAPDVFLTGEFHLPDKPTVPPGMDQKHHKDLPFAGYHYGYNRSLLANRVHDLLTVIAFARTSLRPREIHLLGTGKAGAWALLARGLAGDAIQRAALDLSSFNLEQVRATGDVMFFPGALKYGGVSGFLALCDHGRTLASSVPPAHRSVAGAISRNHVSFVPPRTPVDLAEWLVRSQDP
jgi:dienelactone hydrolase